MVEQNGITYIIYNSDGEESQSYSGDNAITSDAEAIETVGKLHRASRFHKFECNGKNRNLLLVGYAGTYIDVTKVREGDDSGMSVGQAAESLSNGFLHSYKDKHGRVRPVRFIGTAKVIIIEPLSAKVTHSFPFSALKPPSIPVIVGSPSPL